MRDEQGGIKKRRRERLGIISPPSPNLLVSEHLLVLVCDILLELVHALLLKWIVAGRERGGGGERDGGRGEKGREGGREGGKEGGSEGGREGGE